MIWHVMGWGTVGLTAVTTIVVCYALVVTALYPTAWANRIVVAPVPDDEFKVHGDDTVGLY